MHFVFGLVLAVLAAPAADLGAESGKHPIPEAFGPYLHPSEKDLAVSKSFTSTDRIVGSYYFYWYCTDTKEHIVNGEDGSDGLTDHPPTLDGFCYKSALWHKQQLVDMEAAGIDVALLVFWGAPSERDPQASLHWSYAGLGPLVQARAELIREQKNPPRIGLFYDTSTLQYNQWHEHVDLTTDYGKQWFYATIRDFFSALPPRDWAMIDGKPIVLLYAAAFAKKHDQGFVDFTRAQFKTDFGRELYLAPQDSWRVKGDNTCAWGGAFGTKNPGIGELGPGYNDTAVYGRKPLIANREAGKFYEANWLKFLRQPSPFVMIETWSEFHEGTEICESKEYGRQYIDLTRKYVDLFKKGWMPAWPKGKFTGAKSVDIAAGGSANGLILVDTEDGRFSAQTVAGSNAWVLQRFQPHTLYLYAKADDSFKWSSEMNATLEIEFFDSAPGSLGIEFDGSDPSAPFGGAYTSGDKIQLAGDRKWKTARFQLTRARLLNSQNGGADFRLVAQAPEFAARRLRVLRN